MNIEIINNVLSCNGNQFKFEYYVLYMIERGNLKLKTDD